MPWVLGLNQGVFRLDQVRGAWLVRGDPRREAVTLAAFERDVRFLAGAAQ
jgi:hypothetical protein